MASLAKQRLKEGHYTKEMAKTIINKTKASAYFYKTIFTPKLRLNFL